MLERDLAYASGRASTGVRAARPCSPTSRSSTAAAGAAARRSRVRELEQWFFRITRYADELLESAEQLTGWPEKVLTMQRNWIGRSEGARVRFALAAASRTSDRGLFTTRIDTIYGANFLLLAPEHPLVQDWSRGAGRRRVPAQHAAVPGAGPHRPDDRRDREGRVRHRPRRDQSVHEPARPDLGRELRAGRVRHRRGHGRAWPRSARLRVRARSTASRSRSWFSRTARNCPPRR